jgi:hypothetical protein
MIVILSCIVISTSMYYEARRKKRFLVWRCDGCGLAPDTVSTDNMATVKACDPAGDVTACTAAVSVLQIADSEVRTIYCIFYFINLGK